MLETYSGRDSVEAVLPKLKQIVLKRTGMALALWGAAGIGKTHTAQALLRQTPCPSFSLPSTALLKRWLEVLPKPKTLELWAERILERIAAGEPLASADAANALGTLLARLAPVVLYLEDIHEASPERLELIVRLAEIVQRSKGVGLLLTSRNPLPKPIEGVRLEPLSAEGSKTLLESQAGAELPSEALEWIFAKAAGNPLFTLEYFRHLSRLGNLWNDGRQWRWREPERRLMPSTVEALVEQTLQQAAYTPELEQALQAKAVLGLGNSLWAEVLGVTHEALSALIQPLEQRGVLSVREFAHPLYREVVLQNLLPERRQVLARRALELLDEQPEQAINFVDDAGLTPAQVLAWLARAEQAAEASGQSLQAARYKARAVQYTDDPTERARRAFEAGVALYPHDHAQSIRLLQTAWALSPGDFEVFKHLTVELAEAGRGAEADRLFEDFPEADRTSNRGFMLTLHVWHYLDRYADVIRLWQANPARHEGISAIIVRDVVYAKASLGDTAGALELALQTLAQPELSVLQRVVLLEGCGYASTLGSDFRAAEGFYDQAIALFEADGQGHRCGSLLFNRSITGQLLGNFATAIEDGERALRLATEGDHGLFYANAQLSLGSAWIELGRFERAEELLQSCFAYYQQMGMPTWQIDTGIKLGELYRQWSAPHAGILAQKHQSNALRLARTMNNPRYGVGTLLGAALAEARFGSPQQAQALAEEGYALAGELNDPINHCLALQARAAASSALGQTNQAIDDYRNALEIAVRVEAQLEAAKIGLEIARLTNDHTLAREHLNWFEERGLMNGVNIALSYFPQLQQASVSDSPKPQMELRLEVLGSMQMVREGQSQAVRGQKRREFLAMLLEARIAGRREVSKLDLLETLYPDTDELQASTSLKDIVYQVRELYGPASVQTSEGGYALGEVESDVEEFLRSGDTRLWRGAYLDGLSLDGLETVRESLYTALLIRAQALLQTDPAEAARLGDLLLEADPYAPEHLRLTLQALQASKNYKRLSRTYTRAQERMSEVGERLPDSWQAFVDKTA